MKPFNDPNRSYIAAIADTLKEKPTNTAPEEPHEPDLVAQFSGLPAQLDPFYYAPLNQLATCIIDEAKLPEAKKGPDYATYHEGTHDRYMQGMYDQQGAGKFDLKLDKTTRAKIPEFLKPPKFTDRYFGECHDRWKFPQTLGAAFSQANKPEQAPAAKPAEQPVFDFDAGRAAVYQFSGGARVPKLDPSNKP